MTGINLPPDLLEIAIRDLNEDPKRRQSDIEAIKEWLRKQPHLNPRYDDDWILTFLRGCKFSLQRTKEKLETFYTYKTLLPEFFSGRDPLNPSIHEILKAGLAVPLPKPDAKGRQIVLLRVAKNDPKKYTVNDMMKANYINMDTGLISSNRGVVAGDALIMDCSGMNLDHVTMMSPSLMKKSMTVYQDAYPMRPQAIHYINTNSIFESIFNFMKTFMKKKLQDRIHVHGSNMEKLYEHFPRDVLPEEYGGTLPSIEVFAEEYVKKVESLRPWFLEEEKYGSDESKRIGKPKTSSDVFGLEGSFRTLAVD